MGWTRAELAAQLAGLWDRYQRWKHERENPLPVPLLPGDVAVIDEVVGPPPADPEVIKRRALEAIQKRKAEEEAEEDAG